MEMKLVEGLLTHIQYLRMPLHYSNMGQKRQYMDQELPQHPL